MHFVLYKVPYMSSFRIFANRLIIENPKQNHAAENGSDAKSGYFWVNKAINNIFFSRPMLCSEKWRLV